MENIELDEIELDLHQQQQEGREDENGGGV